ncbi:CDP-diacylglycerol--serine O-phosphatidyltransferase [bacterium]|nr:CDP-diacylglycerol--serine O-phosphatidyltransferase [bacterium]
MRKVTRFRPKIVRPKIEEPKLLIPSLVTVIGLFFGFLATMYAIKGQYAAASQAIAIAMFLDIMDGRIARRLNATTAFGKEFDSLCDMQSFGIAPAVLVYSWAFAQQLDEFGVLVAFCLVAAGAFRLARFNVQTEMKKNFTGLPIPGAAACIAAMVYAFPYRLENQYLIALIALYTFTLSLLMASRFPFLGLKKVKLKDINPAYFILSIAVLVGLSWYLNRWMFLLLSLSYLATGPAIVWQERRQARTPQAGMKDQDWHLEQR